MAPERKVKIENKSLDALKRAEEELQALCKTAGNEVASRVKKTIEEIGEAIRLEENVQKHLIVVGALGEKMSFVGPFSSARHAMNYGYNLPEYHRNEWDVIELRNELRD